MPGFRQVKLKPDDWSPNSAEKKEREGETLVIEAQEEYLHFQMLQNRTLT